MICGSVVSRYDAVISLVHANALALTNTQDEAGAMTTKMF